MIRIAYSAALRRHCVIVGAHSQQILSVPFDSRSSCRSRPAASTDAIGAHHGRSDADNHRSAVRDRERRCAGRQHPVGRVARAQPDGLHLDIETVDTHVGSIIYKLNLRLQKDFRIRSAAFPSIRS